MVYIPLHSTLVFYYVFWSSNEEKTVLLSPDRTFKRTRSIVKGSVFVGLFQNVPWDPIVDLYENLKGHFK
jgi:hypothetical protein